MDGHSNHFRSTFILFTFARSLIRDQKRRRFNNSCNSKESSLVLLICVRDFFLSLWIDKENPRSQKWISFAAQIAKWAISKSSWLAQRFSTIVSHAQLYYTWQKCNCLGFHHYHHWSSVQDRMETKMLCTHTHLIVRLRWHGDACVDTFSSLFKCTSSVHTLFTVHCIPVRICNECTDGTCNFSQYNETTHRKCHRLTYCMRWNFATCIRMHALSCPFHAISCARAHTHASP